MDQNQLAGHGYINHQYGLHQDGHHQDDYHQHHQQFDPQASYDNYSSQQHLPHSQYSPEYSGCYVKSEPEDFKYSSSSYEQYYGGGGYQDIEKYKLERKRERNRIAATKCRMRKLERIAQLDSEVGQLKEQNMQLAKEGDCLRGELNHLKDILKKHVESGECRLQGTEKNLSSSS